MPSLAELTNMLRIEGSAVVFRHPLMRSAIYHEAGPADRRVAHLALAGALAGQEGEADRREWHLAQAAVGPDEDVAAELERSAGRALRRSGHAVAALALQRAADLSLAGEGRARRLVAAADAAWRGGDALRCRAGGPGRRRGGLGQRVRVRKLYDDGQPAFVGLHPQGIEVDTPGHFGGRAGRRAGIWLQEGPGWSSVTPSSAARPRCAGKHRS